jgi:hypothetical protein
MSQSEVARLMQQIAEEYQAGQQALHGLSLGTAQHRFITKRMENMGELHLQLRAIVGDEAMPLIVKALEEVDQSQTNPT